MVADHQGGRYQAGVTLQWFPTGYSIAFSERLPMTAMDQVQRGLPIGPFRLAPRADIPPAHLATRVFGEFARTCKSLGFLD